MYQLGLTILLVSHFKSIHLDFAKLEYWLRYTTRYIRYITPLHVADYTPTAKCCIDLAKFEYRLGHTTRYITPLHVADYTPTYSLKYGFLIDFVVSIGAIIILQVNTKCGNSFNYRDQQLIQGSECLIC